MRPADVTHLLPLLHLPALFDPQWTGAKADFDDLDKIFPDAVLQLVGGGQLKLPIHHCIVLYVC
jgi:hypothetical protein